MFDSMTIDEGSPREDAEQSENEDLFPSFLGDLIEDSDSDTET